MNKLSVIFFLIIITSNLKSQTKNHHIIGINAEFSTMPKIVNSRLGTNLTYLYSYKKFCSKLEIGIIPNSNFGTVVKGAIYGGFTTDINVAISAHGLIGILVLEGSKSYRNNIGYNYRMDISNVGVDVGTLIRPSKNERITLGLDLMISGYYFEPQGYTSLHSNLAYYYNGFVPFFNFSFNYKLNTPHRP